MNTVTVPADFLTKVVGFAEATKGILDKQASSKDSLTKAATEAVAALVKKGYVEPNMSAQTIERFVATPELIAMTLTKAADFMKQAGQQEEVKPIGAADRTEDKPVVKSAHIAPARASDAIWDNAFRR